MLLFPNCKINLGLNIVAKRNDGFHDIETVFIPVGLKDAVEVIVAEKPHADVELTNSGLVVIGDLTKNLCVRAYRLLSQEFSLPPVLIHLHKHIPMGAGLGGGSADGAFTLKLLNEKFNLNLSNEKLIEYALQLGSDCPFFIINTPCFATSRGEVLQPVELNLASYQIVLINPNIHIATAWAFTKTRPQKPLKSVQQIIQQPIATWKKELVNDFEEAVFDEHPVIAQLKDMLYKKGAVYASMTGTGSTVFGIFEKQNTQPRFDVPKDYFLQWVEII